jgi:copper chaperone CopZ
MKQYQLNIKGMGSQHCVMVVKGIITKLEGVSLQDVGIGTASIAIDETKSSKETVVAAIEKMGYKVIS